MFKLLVFLSIIAAAAAVDMLHPSIVTMKSKTKLATSGQSSLYSVQLPSTDFEYDYDPLVLSLKGTRHQIGYDYAALLSNQTIYTLETFATSVFGSQLDQDLIMAFVDFCWDSFLVKYTPQEFLEELKGMDAFHQENGGVGPSAGLVARRFYTLANMPADPQNIIAMLEQEEEVGWPNWLKNSINEIIKILERLLLGCDAYGVWGPRTVGGLLYSSRNLDYNSNTGINKYKLAVVYDIDDPKFPPVKGRYVSFGFSFGLGALAGISDAGVTVSEMNLDNSVVTFSGLAFPLRLRYVLENADDLDSAMTVWNATNNTNSFNFLIGSAKDASAGNNGAYALETIMDFTAQFGADSPIEAAATYDCPGTTCHKWTNQTGVVHIGHPLPNAVWRTNHGLHPKVMATQEPLFNNTVFRYNLMHDLFAGLEQESTLINDTIAVDIVATLGIKGVNYLTCDQKLNGDNVMSIAYAPRTEPGKTYAYVAWESGSGDAWRPAACSPYMLFKFSDW